MSPESFAPVQNDQAELVHQLTQEYMGLLEDGSVNDLFVGEYLAGQIAIGEISEETAETVLENLGIDKVTDD